MKKILSSLLNWAKLHWRGIAVALLVTSIAVITLSLQLSSLVPGQNRFESTTLGDLAHLPFPWHRAVNAPYMLLAYLFGHISKNPLYGARVASVFFGLFATILMYYIIRIWFNIRVATIGTLLFITSSWLLHTTHQATPLILLVLGPLLTVAPLAWFSRTKKYRTLAFIALAASLGVAAYIPFMFWLIIASLAIIVKKEKTLLSDLKKVQFFGAVALYLLIVSPLLISLAHYPGQIIELLGGSKTLPSITEYFSHLLQVITSIFIHAPYLPELRIGHLPALDIFSTAMFILGVYYSYQRKTNIKTITLFSSMLVLLLVIPFSPNFSMEAVILIPFVYIGIITGIVELITQWFAYFPRNPLARNIGISLLVFSITLSCAYHLENYFVAWPNDPHTKSVYVVKS